MSFTGIATSFVSSGKCGPKTMQPVNLSLYNPWRVPLVELDDSMNGTHQFHEWNLSVPRVELSKGHIIQGETLGYMCFDPLSHFFVDANVVNGHSEPKKHHKVIIKSSKHHIQQVDIQQV